LIDAKAYGKILFSKMNSIRIDDKSSFQGAPRVEKRERSFELPLPILVSGLDAAGKEIKEYTQLVSISSQEASFQLNSKVMVGSRLNLLVDIPKTYFLENNLKLEASGKVTFIKAEQNSKKKQLVFIRLEKGYRIRSIVQKKP
jgi:hypothetical protein